MEITSPRLKELRKRLADIDQTVASLSAMRGWVLREAQEEERRIHADLWTAQVRERGDVA